MSQKTRRKDKPVEPTTAPFHGHAPTRKELLTATAVALGIALVVLVAAVLPAEYGIDPTGIGRMTGIARLDGSQASDPGAPSLASPAHRPEALPFRTDTVNVTIRPHDGLEYKLAMRANASLVYSWSAPAPLYFDFHGEPTELPPDAAPGYFESHEEDTRASGHGSLRAPFSGRHGWYWQNDGDTPVTVTLRLSGYYDVIGAV